MKVLTLRIGGEGGEGVISSGEILTKAVARSGFHIYTYRTYPAEIRGGLCMFQLRIDDNPVLSAGDKLDVLVAFNQDALDHYLSEVQTGGLVLYDPEVCTDLSRLPKTNTHELPLNAVCRRATESIRGKNVTAIGAVAYLLGIPLDVVVNTVKSQFAAKGDKVAGANVLALVAGYDYAAEKLPVDRLCPIHNPEETPHAKGRVVLSGNQAVSLGALAAGVRFCAGYPITPATPIFEFLAKQLPRFGGYLMQCEDEIAAINACIGSSYGGSKVITPTSGPGMALMSESINLASMAEIPIVIVDVQRSGPSTGMPTKTEQGDLNFALYGTPGEAPRVVMAPSSVEECFHMTVKAFNISERYQIPVILLTDTSLAYRTESVDRFDLKNLEIVNRETWIQSQDVPYQRYVLTESGVSPIAVPGTAGGQYQATGLEHDEFGHPNYSPKYHENMQRKRFAKLDLIEQNLGADAYHLVRPIGSTLGIISWGSTRGTVCEAIHKAAEAGIKVAHFHPHVLSPLPVQALRDFIFHMHQVIVIEENFTGQLAGLIRNRLSVDPISLTKCQGIPFTPDEIVEAIQGVVTT